MRLRFALCIFDHITLWISVPPTLPDHRSGEAWRYITVDVCLCYWNIFYAHILSSSRNEHWRWLLSAARGWCCVDGKLLMKFYVFTVNLTNNDIYFLCHFLLLVETRQSYKYDCTSYIYSISCPAYWKSVPESEIQSVEKFFEINKVS